MRPGRRTNKLRFLAPFILLATLTAWSVPLEIEPEDVAGQQIITRYMEAKQTQQAALRGAQMQVDIDAQVPRLEKQATLRALRTISKVGKITYKALGFSGDSSVKNELIARYLAEETKSSEVSITPVNYKFKYKGRSDRDGQQVQVFQITPRKKALGLFRGELWLDAATSMPVRESGQAVKNPSVFLKKMQFVQEYEIRDGVAFPKHFHGTADVRMIGRAELNIDYSNFTRQELAEDGSANGSDR
jgi:hypothetical protein